ncbi:hypothetical protein ACVIHH_000043 [Bradyrhizobium sp. USDA 4518]
MGSWSSPTDAGRVMTRRANASSRVAMSGSMPVVFSSVRIRRQTRRIAATCMIGPDDRGDACFPIFRGRCSIVLRWNEHNRQLVPQRVRARKDLIRAALPGVNKNSISTRIRVSMSTRNCVVHSAAGDQRLDPGHQDQVLCNCVFTARRRPTNSAVSARGCRSLISEFVFGKHYPPAQSRQHRADGVCAPAGGRCRNFRIRYRRRPGRAVRSSQRSVRLRRRVDATILHWHRSSPASKRSIDPAPRGP